MFPLSPCLFIKYSLFYETNTVGPQPALNAAPNESPQPKPTHGPQPALIITSLLSFKISYYSAYFNVMIIDLLNLSSSKFFTLNYVSHRNHYDNKIKLKIH